MNNNRYDLQAQFKSICPNVYFEPPENFKMQYPCIRYKRSGTHEKRADNKLYGLIRSYEVLVLSMNPDEPMNDIIQEKFEKMTYNTHYVSDGVYIDVYKIYF